MNPLQSQLNQQQAPSLSSSSSQPLVKVRSQQHGLKSQSLIAYVPVAVAAACQTGKVPSGESASETFEAALLFADVSKFSSLAERLSHHKDLDGGSDRLTELMNGYLGGIIDTIIAQGGDIIEFAGDAFLAMWRVEGDQNLSEVTMRALQCALYIQSSVGNYRFDAGTSWIELRLRVEVGAGSITGTHVGVHNQLNQSILTPTPTPLQRSGPFSLSSNQLLQGLQVGQGTQGVDKDKDKGRWAYVIFGDEVNRTLNADHLNTAGNVVVTSAAWKLVAQNCDGELVPDSDVYWVKSMKKSVAIKRLIEPSISAEMDSAISLYIPSIVSEQLVVQQESWLAEVRRVTVAFIKIPMGKAKPSDPTYATLLQQNGSEVMRGIAKFDGMLAHISYDDKGIYAVVVFGIPSHEDDAVRAVYTCIHLAKTFYAKGASICAGIATGVVVAGSVGSAARAQYTLFGTAVNLAARLMHLSYLNACATEAVGTPRRLTPEGISARDLSSPVIGDDLSPFAEVTSKSPLKTPVTPITNSPLTRSPARIPTPQAPVKVPSLPLATTIAATSALPATVAIVNAEPLAAQDASSSSPESTSTSTSTPAEVKNATPEADNSITAHSEDEEHSSALLLSARKAARKSLIIEIPLPDTSSTISPPLAVDGQPVVGNFHPVPTASSREGIANQPKPVAEKPENSTSKTNGAEGSNGTGKKIEMQSTTSRGKKNVGGASITSMAVHTVLCDEETYYAARSRFTFMNLDPVQVKGFTKKILCYAPEIVLSWRNVKQRQYSASDAEVQETVVGREKELQIFVNCIEKMLDDEGGSAMLIEGEPGQGKSTLINACAKIAVQKGYSVMMSGADAIETATPYYAFRAILKQLAGLSETDSNESGRAKIAAIVPVAMHPHLAFFNSILSLDFKETPISSKMKGTVRNDFLLKMVLMVLQQSVREHPTLLIVDDVHWLDSASWRLALAVIYEVHPLIVLLGTRPVPTPMPLTYKQLLHRHKAIRVSLKPLGDSQIAELLVHLLQLSRVRHPPPDLVDMIKHTANGNPFFTRELILALQESGAITVVNGLASYHHSSDPPQENSNESEGEDGTGGGGAGIVRSVSVPRALNTVIIHRVDRLDPEAKLILRVASVLGKNFMWPALISVLPSKQKIANIEEKLGILERTGLVVVPEFTDRQACLEGRSHFSFKHVVIQQVVYNTMVAKQRRSLHQAIARWYVNEHHAADELSFSPIIYHHYLMAELYDEALSYCIKSVDHSMSLSSNKEALEFCNAVWAIKASEALPPPEKARIRTLMGDASIALGRAPDALDHYSRAVVLLGCADPKETALHQSMESLAVLFSYTSHPAPHDKGSKESEYALEAASVLLRYVLTLNWLHPKHKKHLLYSAYIMYQQVLLSGWMDVVPVQPVLILGIRVHFPELTAPEQVLEDQLKQSLHKYKMIQKQQQPQTQPTLSPTLRNLLARSLITVIQHFIGSAQVSVAYELCDQACAFFLSINDLRNVIVPTAQRISGILLEGRFMEAAELSIETTRQCHNNGDFTQFGIQLQCYSAYAMVNMGRLHETGTLLDQVAAAMATAPPGTVEMRAIVTFKGVKCLYHLRKSEYDLAWACIQEVAELICDCQMILYTYIFAYMSTLEAAIVLVSKKDFAFASEVYAATHKLFHTYKRFASAHTVGLPRALLFEAQLTKQIPAITNTTFTLAPTTATPNPITHSLDQQQQPEQGHTYKQGQGDTVLVSMCKHALEFSDQAGLQMDVAMAYFELAKYFPNNILYKERAIEIFKSIGAIPHYMDVCKYFNTE